MSPKMETAGRLWLAAVEEFQGMVVADAEAGRGEYESIVVRHAEVLYHRAERISQETGVSVRVVQALGHLWVRA